MCSAGAGGGAWAAALQLTVTEEDAEGAGGGVGGGGALEVEEDALSAAQEGRYSEHALLDSAIRRLAAAARFADRDCSSIRSNVVNSEISPWNLASSRSSSAISSFDARESDKRSPTLRNGVENVPESLGGNSAPITAGRVNGHPSQEAMDSVSAPCGNRGSGNNAANLHVSLLQPLPLRSIVPLLLPPLGTRRSYGNCQSGPVVARPVPARSFLSAKDTRPAPAAAAAAYGVAGTTTRSAGDTEHAREEGKRTRALKRRLEKAPAFILRTIKPTLRCHGLTTAGLLKERETLDRAVRGLLEEDPSHLVEWFIQNHLIPSSQVFKGSIFEDSPYSPAVMLKLIYYWACQIPPKNIINWTDVHPSYIETFFMYLRAICTAAVRMNLEVMGGLNKIVEVGIISLKIIHTDIQNSRNDVLGAMDREKKIVRLLAVDPVIRSSSAMKKKGEKSVTAKHMTMLSPLCDWVHKQSTISTDVTIDKFALLNIGFTTIIQSPSFPAQASNMKNSNVVLRSYLLQKVPALFQNTLALQHRHITQQFLDELVWRECWGVTPAQAFNNMIVHIAQQTNLFPGRSLVERLQKIAMDPFTDMHWKRN